MYHDLAIKQQLPQKVKVKCIPVDIDASCTITKYLNRCIKKIDLKIKFITALESNVIRESYVAYGFLGI